MRIAIGALALLAAVTLACDSDSARDAAEHLENAADEVGEASEDAGQAAAGEAKSVKEQLSDDSDDNKERVDKGLGNAGDDIKRTFRGLGKKK